MVFTIKNVTKNLLIQIRRLLACCLLAACYFTCFEYLMFWVFTFILRLLNSHLRQKKSQQLQIKYIIKETGIRQKWMKASIKNETNNLFINHVLISISNLASAKLINDNVLIKSSSSKLKFCKLLLMQVIPYTNVIHWNTFQGKTTQWSFMLMSIISFVSFMTQNLIENV